MSRTCTGFGGSEEPKFTLMSSEEFETLLLSGPDNREFKHG